MEMDNDFYEKWKKKSANKKFFAEKASVKEKCPQNDRIFSSTALQDQSETESFSLHLSESYLDETPESAGSQPKQKQVNEVILISDSSIDESIFSFDKTCKLLCNKNVNLRERKDTRILETTDESTSVPINQQPSIEKNRKFNSKPNSPVKQNVQNSRKNVVIEESDSEVEHSRVPDIIKETVTESVTLSDRKKKEILQWLSSNFNGSRCGSSCSQESAVTSSRKSGVSSGNSSLERLELNFETPNNRGKLSKPSTTKKSNTRHRIDTATQSTLDQYFTKSKKGQLDIVKDRTPGSKHSDKTPVNKMKYNPRKILSELDSVNSGTPSSKNSDKTPMNVRTKQRIIIPESESFDSKNQENTDKILVPESESLGSQNNANEKQIIISESESADSPDFIKNYKKNLDLNYNNKSSISKKPQDNNVILSETVPLETSSDADILNSSSGENQKNKDNQGKNQAPVNTTIDTTLNDCADILENLYGTTWRNKAKILVSATEPKKQTTKKIFSDVQTEKKITFRKPRFDDESDDSLLEKENNVPKKTSQTTSKKSKSKKKVKDNFINDSTTESSPECSYYTAMSNPVQSQHNPVQTTVKAIDKKKVIAICDSDSDNETWKIRGKNQRKLSFDSSTSSSTSEFDPEDIVPPKMKSTKISKPPVGCQAAKISTIRKPEAEIESKSFLASLSKDVPLKEADFRAMTFRVKYKSMKEELCKELYKLFNEKVFSNQLPDDMPIEWSTRLRGTAGKCYNKQSLKALGKTVRSSRIVLATKIIDSPDRLRDTLIHEMCHAATWLINNISDGHGSFWKAWANRAIKVFPELPPISRCHNYEIQTKYTYKCTSCGYSVGRHSKSLDLNRKRCGYCHGTFELLINKVTKAGTVQKKTVTQREPSGFALYVKENYHLVRQKSASTVKHAEVMKILGQQFSAVKLTPKPEDRVRNNQDESP